MNRRAFFVSLISLSLAANAALAQKGCDFDMVGTWKASTADGASSVFYRFAPDGKVTVLTGSNTGQGSNLREIATATYKLAPKTISFTATKAGGIFTEGTTSVEISEYDGVSLTCVKPGSAPARWVKVDNNRYFIVFVARVGTFYDKTGPAFPMLIKRAEGKSQIDAVGVYSAKGKRAFGPVPAEAYKEFMKETRGESDVMLRLEINSAQYERALKILRVWERRVREDALFYPKKGSMDNILLVREVAESLTRCGEKIKIYNLNYVYDDDWISDKYGAPLVPFHYFKELRRLNESLHVRDEAFPAS